MDAGGLAIVGVAALAIVATAGWLRTRARRSAVLALLALEGAALGAGGLLLLHDVGIASWIAAPLALAIGVPLHVTALFSGDGPFRT